MATNTRHFRWVVVVFLLIQGFERKFEVAQSTSSSFSRYSSDDYRSESHPNLSHITTPSPQDSFEDTYSHLLTKTTTTTPSIINEKCHLHLAKSSIPNSGLGMYTSITIPPHTPTSHPQIGIPLIDVERNHNTRERYADSLLSRYPWSGHVLGYSHMEASDVKNVIPGLGMLANSHMGLWNMAMDGLSVHRRYWGGGLSGEEEYHGTPEPYRGSASNYHDVIYQSTKEIPSGSEIFVNYGEDWFEHYLEGEERLVIPFQENYDKADEIIQQFLAEDNVDEDEQQRRRRWNDVLGQYVGDAKTYLALPRNVEDLKRASLVGTARFSLPDSIRSEEWLDENGVCLDSLHSGRSMIPQAGYGAYATRSFQPSELIAPLPLIFTHRSDLRMTHGSSSSSSTFQKSTTRQQLLLNYCFGHSQSSLLLFPYSPTTTYPNHSSTAPNAYIRWSSSSSSLHHNEELWKLPLQELLNRKSAGLMFDLVASREIQLGEEVLIDYGMAWEEAWLDHSTRFRGGYNNDNDENDVNEGGKRFTHVDEMSAVRMNHDPKHDIIRTVSEQVDEPYHHVQTACYFTIPPEEEEEEEEEEDEEYGGIRWKMGPLSRASLHPCDILSRESTDDGNVHYYEARMYDYGAVPSDSSVESFIKKLKKKDTTEEESDSNRSNTVVVKYIPRWAIRFEDASYTSDLHWKDAFRHEIGIPDGALFPPHWLDLK